MKIQFKTLIITAIFIFLINLHNVGVKVIFRTTKF